MRTLICLLFLPTIGICQILSPERIIKLKQSTVKITIENTDYSGTGFFVNANGAIVTCFHVIVPALDFDAATYNIKIARRIFVTMKDGAIIEAQILADLFKFPNRLDSANINDFCILVPAEKRRVSSYLPLGTFDNIKEGGAVYTCGYPLGMDYQFVSQGILSTKFVREINNVGANGKKMKFKRSDALMDITLNRGNSGGPVMSIGKTPADDRVIGIADFIVSPHGNQADSIVKAIKKAVSIGEITSAGIPINATLMKMAEFIGNTSIGVSGCVSIEHLRRTMALSE